MNYYTVKATRIRTVTETGLIDIEAESPEKAIEIATQIDAIGDLGFVDDDAEWGPSTFHADEIGPVDESIMCHIFANRGRHNWDSTDRVGYKVCLCGAIRQHPAPETGE
jgi:hypothetical protein